MFETRKKINLKEAEKDILLIGEALIDKYSKSSKTIKEIGEAPLNVALTLTKKKIKNNFYGMIGDDKNSELIAEYFLRNNLDDNLLIKNKDAKTTVANIFINEEGERNFVFERGADENLIINFENIKNYSSYCFSSATAFLGGNLYNSYKQVLDYAFANEKEIIFDPNYRNDLYKDKINDFVKKSKYFISKSNVIKMSVEELGIIYKIKWTSIDDNKTVFDNLNKFIANAKQFFLITIGKYGTLFIDKNKWNLISSFEVKQIDTTGAGDIFLGSFISKYLSRKEKIVSKKYYDEIFDIIKYANINGALATTKIGVENSIITKEDETNYEIF